VNIVAKFWTLPKRPPEPIEFNPNDQTHIDFIYHTACLYATIFKIKPHQDFERLKQVPFLFRIENCTIFMSISTLIHTGRDVTVFVFVLVFLLTLTLTFSF
jgi:hypothetical protein